MLWIFMFGNLLKHHHPQSDDDVKPWVVFRKIPNFGHEKTYKKPTKKNVLFKGQPTIPTKVTGRRIAGRFRGLVSLDLHARQGSHCSLLRGLMITMDQLTTYPSSGMILQAGGDDAAVTFWFPSVGGHSEPFQGSLSITLTIPKKVTKNHHGTYF